jgi:hypothetical protein
MADTSDMFDWNDAEAAVDNAIDIVASMSANNAPGSPEEAQYAAACSAVSAAINRLIETPAPDVEGVCRKVELLTSQFLGAEPEELQHIGADLTRIAEADQSVREIVGQGVDGIIELMEQMADDLPADWSDTSLFWTTAIQNLAELTVAMRDKVPVAELSDLLSAGGIMIAHLKQKRGESPVDAQAKPLRGAIH